MTEAWRPGIAELLLARASPQSGPGSHSFIHSFISPFRDHPPCARPGQAGPLCPEPRPSALQTLLTAVGQTVYTVASVLILFFVLMFIFAILGFCLFGAPERGDLNNWGNLALAFFTLFSLATVPCLGKTSGGGALGRACQLV